ncbi:MAG: biopolymer transporter ExbD [Lentisphaeria bacterium]|nr:biopolymer transporter ExbD [Lentisphaeria bacterium]
MRTKIHLKPISGCAPLVPLVDVFYILLVCFMISSSLVFWPGTKVETSLRLPRARVSSMGEADKLVVTITRSGQVFFNDRNVAWEDLERELSQRVHDSRTAAANRLGGETGNGGDKGRHPMLVLRADREIAYEQFFDVMTLGRSLGLDVWLVSDSSDTGVRTAPPVLGDDLD